MRFRKREPLFRILLDTGLQLVDSLRGRSPDNMEKAAERNRRSRLGLKGWGGGKIPEALAEMDFA